MNRIEIDRDILLFYDLLTLGIQKIYFWLQLQEPIWILIEPCDFMACQMNSAWR